jgi:hypothetical protein
MIWTITGAIPPCCSQKQRRELDELRNPAFGLFVFPVPVNRLLGFLFGMLPDVAKRLNKVFAVPRDVVRRSGTDVAVGGLGHDKEL